MLREGIVKLSTFTAPAGTGYFTASVVVALADGFGLSEGDADDIGDEPPVGPSYPRVNTKMTMPRRIAATTPRLTSTIVIIGNERRPLGAVAAAGCAACAGCRAAGVGV